MARILDEKDRCERCGGFHSTYPHPKGYHYGCYQCETVCHCDSEAIRAGRETKCVWDGHTYDHIPDIDDLAEKYGTGNML